VLAVADIMPLPKSCREYLGINFGNCPKRSAEGPPFCEAHRQDRDDFITRSGRYAHMGGA